MVESTGSYDDVSIVLGEAGVEWWWRDRWAPWEDLVEEEAGVRKAKVSNHAALAH